MAVDARALGAVLQLRNLLRRLQNPLDARTPSKSAVYMPAAPDTGAAVNL
jgi:hypothetical protein